MIRIPNKMAMLEDIHVSCTDGIIGTLKETVFVIDPLHRGIIREHIKKTDETTVLKKPTIWMSHRDDHLRLRNAIRPLGVILRRIFRIHQIHTAIIPEGDILRVKIAASDPQRVPVAQGSLHLSSVPANDRILRLLS